MIEELIPLIGDRSKFCNKYKLHILHLTVPTEIVDETKKDILLIESLDLPSTSVQDNSNDPIEVVKSISAVDLEERSAASEDFSVVTSKGIYFSKKVMHYYLRVYH